VELGDVAWKMIPKVCHGNMIVRFLLKAFAQITFCGIDLGGATRANRFVPDYCHTTTCNELGGCPGQHRRIEGSRGTEGEGCIIY